MVRCIFWLLRVVHSICHYFLRVVVVCVTQGHFFLEFAHQLVDLFILICVQLAGLLGS